MKKIILIILTIFSVISLQAQTSWTLPQGLGGTNSLITANGGLRVPKGIIIGNFVDSFAVNATQADFYEGLYVDIAGILHRRTNNRWLRIGSDKQNLVTVTTNFTSGPSTWNQLTGLLNIPNYAGGAATIYQQTAVPYANNVGILTTDSTKLSFTNEFLTIGGSSTTGISGIMLNQGRGEINAQFGGMRFNIGSGSTPGTYDAAKSYIFQNRGNIYLTMGTTAITGGVNNADFTGNVLVAGNIKIAGGSPGIGKVLTGTDALGNANWQTPAGGATALGTPSNPYINAHFVDPSGQQWILRMDINGALVTQKYPIIVTTYTEAITWKTLYFATITPAGTGGFTTDAISTSFETVKEFTGSGSLTYKYSTPTPTAAGTDIGFGINVGTQYISMAYVYEVGVSKFKFTTNTSYGSLAEITGATVDISKFYRWVRTGNLISIYSDVSENGTFSTLIRSFPEAYTASNVYGSGYINKAGDGILSGKYISNNLITVR